MEIETTTIKKSYSYLQIWILVELIDANVVLDQEQNLQQTDVSQSQRTSIQMAIGAIFSQNLLKYGQIFGVGNCFGFCNYIFWRIESVAHVSAQKVSRALEKNVDPILCIYIVEAT